MNLANCKPTEFLMQTYRIKKSVEKWLKDTNILSIRKQMPKLTPITKDMSEEERKEVFDGNRQKIQEQATKNFMAILDEIMGEHPKETLEILALCCFVEPSEVDNHPIEFYFENLTELITNKAVVGFFTSLMQLGQTITPDA